MGKRLAAVVVLYHPDSSVPDNIRSYLSSVDLLYIFDNSPSESRSVVEEFKGFQNVQYVTNGKNVGLADALNTVARMALDDRFEYLLTMDQDSKVDPGMVEKLAAAGETEISAGIISPLHIVEDDILPDISGDTEYVLTAMTSGNLLKLDVFKKVGGFDGRLFIDYIDHEYCLRLYMNGYKVLRVNSAELLHKVGDLKKRRFIYFTVHPSYHSPQRWYYQTRNRSYIWKKYGNDFPGYCRADRWRYIKNFVKMLVFEDKRMKKLKMICLARKAFSNDDFSNIPME